MSAMISLFPSWRLLPFNSREQHFVLMSLGSDGLSMVFNDKVKTNGSQ